MDVSARIGTLELAETFVISRSARDSEDVVVVELRHSGVSGFGEAQPIDRYGETVESAQAFVEEHANALGDDPFALEEVMERLPAREFAARAALDAALHDLQGKLLGQPVWRLLGLRRSGPPTSWTVWLGDPDDMARRAEKALHRFRRLKLKLGGRDGLDVDRVGAVRGVAGELPLQVDVNGAWSLDEALEALPALAGLGVEYCEQPLPAGDPDGPELKKRSPIPIYVDEDCHTLRDVAACAERAHRDQRQAREVGRDPRRRSGWCTPPARSGSAACWAAWSSRASASLRVPRSRRSSTTSISTATSCSRRIRGRASRSSTASSSHRTHRDSACNPDEPSASRGRSRGFLERRQAAAEPGFARR